MRSFEEQPDESRSRVKVIVIAGLVVVALALAAWLMSRRPAPVPESKSAETTAPAAARAAPPAVVPEEAPKEAPATRPRARKDTTPPPPAPAPEAPAGPTLRIESDVPGASVFVDRQYLGETPVTTTAVAPGAHQLNASAQGYDGVAQSIQVGESGTTEVTVRFREVKLNAAIGVVHKHAMGRCEGRLVADLNGLRYETPNKGDAFSIPWGQVETFEVNYLEKNLRVKKQGGKTWNFTDKEDNADHLFVFHRDVTKARQKLAAEGGH